MTRRRALVGADILIALIALVASLGWLAFLAQSGWSGLLGFFGLAAAVNVAGGALFALSAVAHLRRSQLRWVAQGLALAVLVAGPLAVQNVLALAQRAASAPTGRTVTSAQGISASFDLEFSGAFSGHFTDPDFLYTIQTCGREPNLTPATYSLHSVIGRVASQRMLLSFSISDYAGPGSYPLTPYGTMPPSGQPRTTFVIDRVIGSLTDNNGEQWDGASGALTVNADGRSGALDAELRSHGDPTAAPLHVRGSWSCSAAQYIPTR